MLNPGVGFRPENETPLRKIFMVFSIMTAAVIPVAIFSAGCKSNSNPSSPENGVPTPTYTPTSSLTLTPTGTPTPSQTGTKTPTYTPTSSLTLTPTNTPNPTLSLTPTPSPTYSPTNNMTSTPTNTTTKTPTSTQTFTMTITSTHNNGGAVTTIAGQAGVTGAINASTGTSSTFGFPDGVAMDTSGNIYVGDSNNQLIRIITSGGIVSTVAGQAGVTGHANGNGTSASFYYPYGVAVDSTGNVYVADTSNSLIRIIGSGAAVSTLTGQAGVTGSLNGPATAALFSYPSGVAVDSSGNIYVADTDNHFIRKFLPGGDVTTLAGQAGVTGSSNGPGSASSFYYPNGVAVDSSGNVYVADTSNSLIREIAPDGTVSTLAGQAGVTGSMNGSVASASFSFPDGVAVDNYGNVYVADTGNQLIRKITSGTVSTLAGQAGTVGHADGTGTGASFNYPQGIAVDSAGNVYVADTGNSLIRKIQ